MAAIAAVFFRFLRQPSRPNAPRPVAKSGRAAGSGEDRLLLKVIVPVRVKSAIPSREVVGSKDVRKPTKFRYDAPSGLFPAISNSLDCGAA